MLTPASIFAVGVAVYVSRGVALYYVLEEQKPALKRYKRLNSPYILCKRMTVWMT